MLSEIELQKKTESTLRVMGKAIEEFLENEISIKLGFALIVFEFNKPGLGNYISNGKREDMIKALKETVERLEGNEDISAAIGEA